MEYTVAADFYVEAFDTQLHVGEVLFDGDFEPDIIAQLLSQGTIVNASVPVVEDEEEAPKQKKSKG